MKETHMPKMLITVKCLLHLLQVQKLRNKQIIRKCHEK